MLYVIVVDIFHVVRLAFTQSLVELIFVIVLPSLLSFYSKHFCTISSERNVHRSGTNMNFTNHCIKIAKSSFNRRIRNDFFNHNHGRFYSSDIEINPFVRYKNLETSPEKILITGSLGQLGSGLANVLRYLHGRNNVLMTDIVKLSNKASDIGPYCYLNVLDQRAIEEVVVNKNIDTIVHFSAILSAIGEANVPLALKVNAEGVGNILEVARKYHLKVFIPSTIGAFGPTSPRILTPDICIQRPRTIYGVTKVYAELLGEYYFDRFGVDFRSLRFPGIIDATEPGGGTTDYAIKIFYDALQFGKHKCYLAHNTRLPMMHGVDCTASTVLMLSAESDQLSYRTYNVAGFSFTPEELAAEIQHFLPLFKIEYEICPIRQKIADSWPESLNDEIARRDWKWKPHYDLKKTVESMLTSIKDCLDRKECEASSKTAMSFH